MTVQKEGSVHKDQLEHEIVDRKAYERAKRMDAPRGTWKRDVVDLMSDEYCIYHWCMLPLLAIEAVVLVLLAVLPLWFGPVLWLAAFLCVRCMNRGIAFLAYRRWTRLREKARGWGD